jgi:NodT family efflux transporter outer membrane factor (OMF) lipoprotein
MIKSKLTGLASSTCLIHLSETKTIPLSQPMKLPHFYISVACFGLLGCTIKPAPKGAEILTDAAKAEIPSTWQASNNSGPLVPGWIRSFDDSTLTRIVEDALIRNPDLKSAYALVEASQAAVRVTAASLYPRVAMKGLGERQGREMSGSLGLGINPPDLGSIGVDLSGGSTDINTVDSSMGRWITGIGIGASWEADVWGRVRSKRASARADSAALEADFEFARQSLAASVAKAYFSTIEASQQASNAREALGLYEEYVSLTGKRKEQGFSSDYELAQLKSRTAGAQDTLYAAEAARAQAIRAIEVVTSYYPSGKLSVRASFPPQVRSVPSGLPSELLERRPDLIAAERRFAASFHRAKEARAARLPRFALSANGGLGTAQLDGVGVVNAVNWTLANGIVQPIFFGGELKAAEDIRKAEQRAAAASYTSAALQAFKQVEDALDSDYHLRRREGALNDMVTHSATAVILGKVQLDQGQTDMFTILRLVGENLAAKMELTKIRASRLRERANLHLALGGDFRAPSGK